MAGRTAITEVNTAQNTLTALLTSTSYAEAGKKLGISTTALVARIRKYKLQKHLNKITQHIQNDLLLAGVDVANELVKLTKSKNEAIRLKAIESVLDRIGVAKKEPQQVTNNNAFAVKIVEAQTEVPVILDKALPKRPIV